MLLWRLLLLLLRRLVLVLLRRLCCCGGYSCCCGGYSCCCGGWYSDSSYYSCCCGGYMLLWRLQLLLRRLCGGYAVAPYAAPAYAAPAYAAPAYAAPTPAPAPAEAIPALPAPKPQATASYQATVVVKAPMDATITVNGQSLDHAKAEQVFASPDLEQGKAYAYDFQVQMVRDGKTVTRNEKVTVKAGQQSRVDFSELSRKDAPAHVTIKAPADAPADGGRRRGPGIFAHLPDADPGKRADLLLHRKGGPGPQRQDRQRQQARDGGGRQGRDGGVQGAERGDG